MSEIQFIESGKILCRMTSTGFLVESKKPSLDIARFMLETVKSQYTERPSFIRLLIENKEVIFVSNTEISIDTVYFKNGKSMAVIARFIELIKGWLV